MGGFDRDAVAAFVYREARLIDEGRYKEWHSLWHEGDVLYLVPCNDFDIDTSKHLSLIFDDARRLDERIFRLTNADAHSQEPRSRTTHLMTGIEIDDMDGGDVRVHAAMAVCEVRKARQEIYTGRVDYRLRPAGNDFKMTEKRVHLIRNDSPLGNMTFLV